MLIVIFYYLQSVDDDDGHDTKSLHSDLNGYGGKSSLDGNKGGVVSWGSSFERLLEDPAGLHAFAVFLKKEFSAENIYFWTACERYRMIEDATERSREAQAIYTKHLGVGASEPVNVDSKARTIAESNLSFAERDLFMQVWRYDSMRERYIVRNNFATIHWTSVIATAVNYSWSIGEMILGDSLRAMKRVLLLGRPTR